MKLSDDTVAPDIDTDSDPDGLTIDLTDLSNLQAGGFAQLKSRAKAMVDEMWKPDINAFEL